jgi:YD repeat-containing protein
MIRKRVLSAFALSFACSISVLAQTHPNVEKGFAADKMYQFGDIDHVNLFNGNLSLTIPISSTPVSDHLALSLTLVYNTKLWSAISKPYNVGGQQGSAPLYTPERRSNAGLGWTLTLGRLLDPSETDVNSIINGSTQFAYMSPDGSDRLFYTTLHNGETATAGVLYSRDNTYLRLSDDGSEKVLESPDGIRRRFESYTDTIPNTTCITAPCPAYTRWRLKRVWDRFENYVDIDYSTAGQWTITDHYGRVTTVHFLAHASDVDAEYLQQVSSVEVPKQGGGTTSYTFSYEGVDDPNNPQDKWVKTGACDVPHPDTPVGYRLPLLKSLTLPDSTVYTFSYTGPIGDTLDSVAPGGNEACTAGGLASVTLPTKAKISYEYGIYDLPTLACHDDVDATAESSGIKTRTVQDPFNASNDQTWQYTVAGEQSFTYLGGQMTCPGPIQLDAGPSQYINTVTVSTSAEPVAQRTRYYFSVYHGKLSDANGTTVHDYGLPFSRIYPFATTTTRFLSTEVLDASDTPKRSTYLSYVYEPAGSSVTPSAAYAFNARINGSSTVFLDDDEVANNALGKHYADTAFSDFDGVGHYRTKTVSGDLFGSPRTTTTAYNTVDSLVNPGALETGCYESCAGAANFTPPPSTAASTAKWVLNLYPTTTTSESGAAGSPSVQETCFDKTTGFLNGTRTRAGASRDSKDLITVFGSSSDLSLTGQLYGAVTSEKYYGGDLHPLTSSSSQTLCDAVTGTTAPGTLDYDIRHTYVNAMPAISEYYKDGASVGFKFLDQDTDYGTSLVVHSRDTAGVQTDYSYDSSRRVSSVQASGDPSINYTYTNATPSAGANVTIDQTSTTSGTPKASFDYDGLGRLVLQSRTLPRASLSDPTRWTRQKTVYDAMGRKTQVSEWDEAGAPSHFTTSSGFDIFDRPGTITRPDGSTTNVAYHGVRQIDRTAHIHTQSGSDTNATTTEIYDLHERLYKVKEPSDNTIATYSYDVGGRLQSVSMVGDGITQTRSFTYDNRGLLNSEVHPEIGTGGNGTTSYGQYDARGHAHSKTTGVANGVFDLRFAYDESERLTDVYDNGGGRQLKHFDFATANAGTNMQKGKLTQAVRTNHLAAGDIAVTEKYEYSGTSGRTSLRETTVKNGATTLEDYQQSYGYDDLGAITTPGYPTCLTAAPCNGTSPPAGATYTYRDGSLISVPGYAALSYSGNMLAQIDHQNNGVSDLYRQDTSNGMPRPSSIAFQNVSSCTAPSAPVIPTNSPVCAGSTGNTASIPANGSSYQWSIAGGTITSGSTTNTVTYTAGSTGTLTLSVTVTNACGTSPSGTRNVTVASGPTATLTGQQTITRGANATLHVALTGTSPWTLTWSDIGQQTVSVSSFDHTLSSPQTTASYSITAISDGSAAPCNIGPASASVTVTVQMPAPASLTTTLLSDHVVRVAWAAVAGTPVSYRLERSPCLGCAWQLLVSSIAANSYDHTAPATTLPEAWLYHVIATASGTTDSAASPFDYATTANVLFAEAIAPGVVIKGSYVGEIRLAIDKLRAAANLPAYMPPAYSNGWSNYGAQTGLVYASYVLAMRAALSEAAAALNHPVPFFGETPAVGSTVYAYQFTQLRGGVK